ncbi:MAG: glycoside hydrolase family 2 TIM barrel-domain containing protein [Arachidicoccus sp.]|nr:glycoside hydrolase family 2 TIM barrel-domain containing protein [Arachidicoccus sp.]
MRNYLPVLFLIINTLSSSAQRIKQSINTDWLFHKGNIGLNNAVTNDEWETVSIPHSWNTHDVSDEKPGYYQGIGVYWKTLFIPNAYRDKDVYLYFEGAAQEADVYVNNKYVGRHTGSYTAFSFRINDFIKFDGKNNKNEIEIKLNNSHNENIPPLSADFTFYGGIYRDVYLFALNKIHFDADNDATDGVFISTPLVNNQSADVFIKGKITNRAEGKKDIKIISSLFDQKGKLITQISKDVKSESATNTCFEQEINNIKKPELWSPEHPYLYQITSCIIDKNTGDTLDEVSNPLGFRWYKFTADQGFFLNGKHYKLWGASRHQDYPDKANALPDAIHIQDVELLKAMGANLLRVAHYPQDQSLMEACDRIGIITSVEIPVVNAITENDTFRLNCFKMMEEMIRQNYNHPSVMIWAFMNEVLLKLRYSNDSIRQKVYIQHVKELAQSLDSLSRKEDASRYTMIPFHGDMSLYIKSRLPEVPQIIGWNQYSGWYGANINDFEKNMERHHRELSNKPMIVTEYGADGDPRLHSFQPVRFDKSLEYETYFHKVYQKVIADKPSISGAMAWTLADFNAEARKESMPHVNNKGLLTDTRKPKPVYFYYQSRLLKTPYIAIGSRDWDLRSAVSDSTQREQCLQPVEIYTNRNAEISLFQNGRLLKKEMPEQGVAVFNVPFINGINHLEAIITQEDTTIKDHADINFKIIPYYLKDTTVPFSEINISLGDHRYFNDDELGQVWIPEKAYTRGSWGFIGGTEFKMKNTSRQPYGSDKDILGTNYDPIYETQRVGIQQFRLDIPKGRYAVTFHFAELLSNAIQDPNIYNLDTSKVAYSSQKIQKRKFDVFINGKKTIDGLGNDNYLIPGRAYSTKTFVNVTGNDGIVIDFKPIEGETILNGLQVIKIY